MTSEVSASAFGPLLDPHHGGIAARPLHGIAENDVVVLLPDPALRAQVRRADQLFQRIGIAHRRLDRSRVDDRRPLVLDEVPVVKRRLVAQFLDRQVGHDGAAMPDDEALGRRGLADDREIEPPFAEDRLGFLFLLGLEHHEHALLALREHHLVGAHAGLAARHFVEIERDAEIALGAHLDRRTGQPRRAHVLDGDDAALGHDFKAGFEQQLFRERIADLHGRALLLGIGAEFGRRHGGAVDAVAAGFRAEIDDRHADAGRRRIENLVGLGEADRHGVDQDIAVIAAIEPHLAADGRHAEGIAVAADAGDHAGDQRARLRIFRIAERQRVEAGDRPRAHGEDVAQNAADAGRRALIGLDIARVVVALHLEHDGEPVADIDDAGILARPLDHPRRLGRQRAQMDF